MLFWWWFRATRIGITIQATGSNEKSAFLSGVSITRVNVLTYGLSGLFAAGAALYLTTQTGAGSPTIGKDYILPSVAAAVIGGVSLFGGRGHLAGTLIGAYHPDADRQSRLRAQYFELLAAGRLGRHPAALGAGEFGRRKGRAGTRRMSAFLLRNRLIVLAYAGMVVLLLVTALFSPGFLSASNMRSTVVLAAFVGIVALRPDLRHHRRRHRPVGALGAQLGSHHHGAGCAAARTCRCSGSRRWCLPAARWSD